MIGRKHEGGRDEKEISVVIPAYNEAEGIIATLDEIGARLASITDRYEIIVVDDGSTDGMWEQLAQYEGANVHGYRLSRNFGKEAALCAGLEHARGQAVIIMDADMQHPPAMLEQMVAIWREGKADIVECTKRMRGTEPLRNRLGSELFYSLLSKLTGYNLKGASDYKLLDRRVLLAWQSMGERNVFFRGMTQWMGFSKVQLEFDVMERKTGVSRWGFYNLIKLAVGAIIAFSSLPLRLVSLAGIGFLIGALVLGGQTLLRKMTGDAVTGFTTVILLQLIIGCIIMVSLGIIGEYLAAIYKEIKGRPRYLISRELKARDD
ncbi:hypothetical protein PA598K_05285 [Paenibacillus sp. 598K]|uniref:glycosyltransferase family 2 protein n=1 Tax=Paenibacillus sp. 598K TaxID=1117987 RepID=UPI000FFA9F74|nr:glycosyltransferase family 2 protein [Paenibacillus sp. 598K]GBF76793.1 hypothetical protein PA598K_05285 [Paenibacillus sp. 598K]